MPEPITNTTMNAIEDSDVREELSDALDKYISGASEEVANLVFETFFEFEETANGEFVGCPERFQKQISEILTTNIYIPMMMGEDKHIKRK
jgi:hypothetical protein